MCMYSVCACDVCICGYIIMYMRNENISIGLGFMWHAACAEVCRKLLSCGGSIRGVHITNQ